MNAWLGRSADLYDDVRSWDEYLVSTTPLERRLTQRDGKPSIGYVSQYDCIGWIHIPARIWHRLGGVRLKPGEGPIAIQWDSVTTRKVAKKKR